MSQPSFDPLWLVWVVGTGGDDQLENNFQIELELDALDEFALFGVINGPSATVLAPPLS